MSSLEPPASTDSIWSGVEATAPSAGMAIENVRVHTLRQKYMLIAVLENSVVAGCIAREKQCHTKFRRVVVQS